MNELCICERSIAICQTEWYKVLAIGIQKIQTKTKRNTREINLTNKILIRNAENLLKILETAAALVGLYINTTKTEFIAVNTEGTITAQNGCNLEQVNDFNYLGSKIISSKNYIQVKIGSA